MVVNIENFDDEGISLKRDALPQTSLRKATTLTDESDCEEQKIGATPC